MIIKAKKTEQVVTWACMWLTRFNALIDKYLQCLPKLRNSHEINKFIWILRVKPSLRNLYRNYIYFSFKMLRCNKATEDAVLAKIHTCLRVDEAWVNSLPLELEGNNSFAFFFFFCIICHSFWYNSSLSNALYLNVPLSIA